MGKHLYILRHSKSDWSQGGADDHARPINSRGRTDAFKLAQWFRSTGQPPEQIYCSTALRARQTIAPFIEILDIDSARVHYEKMLYLAGLEILLEVVHGILADNNSAMIVAHNPGLDDLVLHLSESEPPLTDSGKLMTTTSLAQFTIPENSGSLKNNCQLVRLIRPKDFHVLQSE